MLLRYSSTLATVRSRPFRFLIHRIGTVGYGIMLHVNLSDMVLYAYPTNMHIPLSNPTVIIAADAYAFRFAP